MGVWAQLHHRSLWVSHWLPPRLQTQTHGAYLKQHVVAYGVVFLYECGLSTAASQRSLWKLPWPPLSPPRGWPYRVLTPLLLMLKCTQVKLSQHCMEWISRLRHATWQVDDQSVMQSNVQMLTSKQQSTHDNRKSTRQTISAHNELRAG